jgi:dipeptidyl aminopeptidase/acylaminoacyl peptidase
MSILGSEIAEVADLLYHLAMIQAHKACDLLLFPDERHIPRKLEDRICRVKRIREFFVEHQ